MPLSPLESAKKLYERYSLKIQDDRLTDTLLRVQSFVNELPDTSEKNEATKRCISRILAVNYPETESEFIITSKEVRFINKQIPLNLKQLLALIFLAIEDNDNRFGDLEKAKVKFTDGLYRIQREYSFSHTGEDRAGEDKPCGPEGTFNRLVEILEGIHPDIVYVEDKSTKYVEAARDPLQSLLPCSTNRDLISLSEVSCFFRDLTFPERQKRAFNKLIRAAASGEQKDIDLVVAMVRANPYLLLERGDVVTRGGTKIINTTVYEFFLGSGHTEALLAMRDADLFARLSNGEEERRRQYERYRPHIEKLRKDVQIYTQAYLRAGNTYESTYEPDREYNASYHLIKPLIELIIASSQADVTAELEQTEWHESELRNKMWEFREKINESQRERTEGMHYAHYTTIIQVLDLLAEKWLALSENYQSYNKCILVFSQIFGYLERVGLPASERFVFARDFHSKQLSTLCGRMESYYWLQDFDFSDLSLTGLGVSFGVIGGTAGARILGGDAPAFAWFFNSHVEKKLSTLAAYAHVAADRGSSVEMRTYLR